MTIKSYLFKFYSLPILTDEICILFSCSDGFFFAVKEVSLLDDGSSQGKQSIYQLQQVGGLSLPIESYEFFHSILFLIC